MSQETINLVVGALIGIVSSLLTLIVGNYFQDRREARKRKWEQQDREINRRIKANDKRMENVRVILDNRIKVCRTLKDYQVGIIESKDIEKDKAEFDSIPELLDTSWKDIATIGALNDELAKTLGELDKVIDDEKHSAIELARKIMGKETLHRTELTRIKDFYLVTERLIGKMETTLEYRSEKVM